MNLKNYTWDKSIELDNDLLESTITKISRELKRQIEQALISRMTEVNGTMPTDLEIKEKAECLTWVHEPRKACYTYDGTVLFWVDYKNFCICSAEPIGNSPRGDSLNLNTC